MHYHLERPAVENDVMHGHRKHMALGGGPGGALSGVSGPEPPKPSAKQRPACEIEGLRGERMSPLACSGVRFNSSDRSSICNTARARVDVLETTAVNRNDARAKDLVPAYDLGQCPPQRGFVQHAVELQNCRNGIGLAVWPKDGRNHSRCCANDSGNPPPVGPRAAAPAPAARKYASNSAFRVDSVGPIPGIQRAPYGADPDAIAIGFQMDAFIRQIFQRMRRGS